MKIFCIGFHKTGTSSMGQALEMLGYSVTGAHWNRDPLISQNVYQLVDKCIPEYDAFQDNPWPVIYEHLDDTIPGSKFILTVREPESWLASVVRHCGNRSTPMREWIYGYGNPRGHEHEYLARYVRHNREVREYFSGREGTDLLIMDLQRGDGWGELCSFLGRSNDIRAPFPHRNRSQERSVRKRLRGQLLARIYSLPGLIK